jgi:hypothetical protein
MTSPRREASGSAPGRYVPGASPLLDIGGEVGALVVYLDRRPASGELEACPADRPADRFHTGVHLRAVGPGEVPVAVFPEVGGGAYDLLDDGGTPVARVRVTGGQVREVDLRRR